MELYQVNQTNPSGFAPTTHRGFHSPLFPPTLPNHFYPHSEKRKNATKGADEHEGMDPRGAVSRAQGAGGHPGPLRTDPGLPLPAALPRAAHHRPVQRPQRLRAAQGHLAPVLPVVSLGRGARAEVLVPRHQPGPGALAERRHRPGGGSGLRQPRRPLRQRHHPWATT